MCSQKISINYILKEYWGTIKKNAGISHFAIRWWFLIGGIIVIIGTGYGILPAARAWLTAHPPHKPIGSTPAELGLSYEVVTFTTASTLEVTGWYLPPENDTVIVLVHGYRGNRSDCLSQAQMLVEHGYGVLLIDLLAHGESAGTQLSLNGQEVLAAVNYLQTRAGKEPLYIGVWGFSLGGLVALQAAAQTTALHGVIADGPFPVATAQDMAPRETLSEWLWMPFDVMQWQVWKLQGVTPAMSTCQALQQSSSPVYLISGIQNQGEYRVQRYYHEVNPERITLWEVPEAGHVESWTTQREAYETRVLEFFSQIFR